KPAMFSGLASVNVPALVRIKPGALDRLGLYLERAGWRRVALVQSAGLPAPVVARARQALADTELGLDSVEDLASLEAAGRLLATALLLNGVSMSIAGTSRPASGSEHLISHALDQVSARPRLHGLQVGVATYVVAQLQKQGVERVTSLLDAVGFFDAIARDPFS